MLPPILGCDALFLGLDLFENFTDVGEKQLGFFRANPEAGSGKAFVLLVG
jgi:hypothetical protein